MYVPLCVAAPCGILALIAAVALFVTFDRAMRARGLCFLGPTETYYPNNLRVERWCILYVAVHRYDGCHSYSDLLG